MRDVRRPAAAQAAGSLPTHPPSNTTPNGLLSIMVRQSTVNAMSCTELLKGMDLPIWSPVARSYCASWASWLPLLKRMSSDTKSSFVPHALESLRREVSEQSGYGLWSDLHVVERCIPELIQHSLRASCCVHADVL